MNMAFNQLEIGTCGLARNPILMEVEPDERNVQLPDEEVTEHFLATEDGGFIACPEYRVPAIMAARSALKSAIAKPARRSAPRAPTALRRELAGLATDELAARVIALAPKSRGRTRAQHHFGNRRLTRSATWAKGRVW
jgi:hypothetical protein